MFEVEIMKKLLIILFILVCVFGANAQTSKSKRLALPANLAKMKDADSAKLLDNPIIKTRLKRLLGKKSYADFMESWETINPIEKKGNFLFSSGCLIHACGHIESAIAIDLVKKTIHAGIFQQGIKSKLYNEDNQPTPKVLMDWFKNLSKIKQ